MFEEVAGCWSLQSVNQCKRVGEMSLLVPPVDLFGGNKKQTLGKVLRNYRQEQVEGSLVLKIRPEERSWWLCRKKWIRVKAPSWDAILHKVARPWPVRSLWYPNSRCQPYGHIHFVWSPLETSSTASQRRCFSWLTTFRITVLKPQSLLVLLHLRQKVEC